MRPVDGPHVAHRDDIFAFATDFDPQPMHLDEEAAKSSLAGGLSGSGWHMCALAMRMQVDVPEEEGALGSAHDKSNNATDHVPGPLVLLFVGRFAFNKGIDVLLEVAKRLVAEGKGNEVRFDLAGAGRWIGACGLDR